MALQVKQLELTADEKKRVAEKLLTMINDEIEVTGTLFDAYSTDHYYRAVIKDIREQAIKNKLVQFLHNSNLTFMSINLVFRRSLMVANQLGNIFVGTTVTVNEHGADFGHTVMSIDVPMDNLEASGIYKAPEATGPYGYISIIDLLQTVDVPEEEVQQPEEHKEEETETKE